MNEEVISIGSYYSVNMTSTSFSPSSPSQFQYNPSTESSLISESFFPDINISNLISPNVTFPNISNLFSSSSLRESFSSLNLSTTPYQLVPADQLVSNVATSSYQSAFQSDNSLTDAVNAYYNNHTSFNLSAIDASSLNESFNDTTNTGYIPYDQRPETYIVPIVFLIIFITGVIGNVTLIILLIKEQLIKVPSYLYILNLSIGDLIVILGTVPFAGTIYTFESWPFGLVVCKFSEFIRDVSIGVSVLTLSAMSIDRYKAAFSTTIRTQGQMRMNNQKRSSNHSTLRYVLISSIKTPTGKIMLIIWFVSILVAIPSAYFSFILPIKHPTRDHESIYICYPYPDYLGPLYPKAVVLFKCLFYYVIPLIIISCCYVSIAVHLWNKSKQAPISSPATTGTSPGKFSLCNHPPCHATCCSTGRMTTTSFSTPALNMAGRSASPAQQMTPKRSTINYGASDERIEASTCLLRHEHDHHRHDHSSTPNHNCLNAKNSNASAPNPNPNAHVSHPNPNLHDSHPNHGDHCNNSTLSHSIGYQTHNSGRESVQAHVSSGLGRSRRKSQSRAKLIMLLVIIFLVCFFPNHLFMMWFYYYPNSQRLYNLFWHVWRIMAFCLTFTSSTLNPITLYLTSDQFKLLFHKYLHSNCYDPGPKSNAHDQRNKKGDKETAVTNNQIDSSDDALPSGVVEHSHPGVLLNNSIASKYDGDAKNERDAKADAKDLKLVKTFSNILEEESSLDGETLTPKGSQGLSQRPEYGQRPNSGQRPTIERCSSFGQETPKDFMNRNVNSSQRPSSSDEEIRLEISVSDKERVQNNADANLESVLVQLGPLAPPQNIPSPSSSNFGVDGKNLAPNKKLASEKKCSFIEINSKPYKLDLGVHFMDESIDDDNTDSETV